MGEEALMNPQWQIFHCFLMITPKLQSNQSNGLFSSWYVIVLYAGIVYLVPNLSINVLLSIEGILKLLTN